MGWANKLLGWTSNNGAEVNTKNCLQTVDVPPSGNNYALAVSTGTIAAGLAANAGIFAMRLNPASTVNAYIESIRIRYTTITAFTTPVTQTRALSVCRGSAAVATGGNALSTVFPKNSTLAASQFESAVGGDIRISGTGALTTTGMTFSQNIAQPTLIHVGAAGAYYESSYPSEIYDYPVVIRPGESFIVRNGANAMDAGGTFCIAVEINWRESATEA